VILTGSFAQVSLRFPPTHDVPPAGDTLIFRSEGLRVAVVNNGIVSLKPSRSAAISAAGGVVSGSRG
jgi:hypothetical protein